MSIQKTVDKIWELVRLLDARGKAMDEYIHSEEFIDEVVNRINRKQLIEYRKRSCRDE